MAGVLPPAIRPAHCEEQLCHRENEGELLVPGTHRANLSPKVTINVITIVLIMIIMMTAGRMSLLRVLARAGIAGPVGGVPTPMRKL